MLATATLDNATEVTIPALSAPTVTIYTKNACVQCKFTKTAFQKLGIVFNEINIDENADIKQELKARGVKMMPFVVTGDQEWSGFRDDKIKSLVAA